MPIIVDGKEVKLEFGMKMPPRELMANRLAIMHKRYGKLEGKQCKTCEHLSSYLYSRRYYKCKAFKVTNSSATDWRVSWPACGKYEEAKESEK